MNVIFASVCSDLRSWGILTLAGCLKYQLLTRNILAPYQFHTFSTQRYLEVEKVRSKYVSGNMEL